MTNPITLNKIDPVIVTNVQQQTAEGVVHTSRKIRVSKDKNKDKEDRYPNKGAKDKLSRLNALLKANGIDITFILQEDVLTAIDKNGVIIKECSADALDEIYNNVENKNGLFVDSKK